MPRNEDLPLNASGALKAGSKEGSWMARVSGEISCSDASLG